MRTRWILFVGLLILLLGYLIGSICPWSIISPATIGVGITRSDYIARVISGLAVGATLLATSVALFKEDLLGLIRSAKLKVVMNHPDCLSEQTIEEESGNGTTPNKVAKKYEIVISVSNVGKLAAKGCHVFLERLVHLESGKIESRDVLVKDPRLIWLNREGDTIHIPRGSKALMILVEFQSPQSSVVEPGGPNVPAQARLVIGQHDFGEIGVGGDYSAHFAVHSENAPSVPFSIEFSWNGCWERRLSEMKERVKVKPKGCANG